MILADDSWNKTETLVGNGTDLPLRVLSLSWGLPFGGGTKYASVLNEVSKTAPITVRHLCILARQWNTDESAIKLLNPLRVYIRSRADLSWMWRVRRQISREHPDMLMVHGFNTYFVAMVAGLGNAKKFPVLCSYHGPYHPSTPLRRILSPLFNALADYFLRRHASAVLTVSAFSKQDLISRGVSPEKITVVHNGIEATVPPPEARRQVRQRWGVSEDSVLLGTISRLEPIKGVAFLVEAFAQLQSGHKNIKLVLVGSGHQEGELREQVEELGLSSSVIFAGFRSDVDRCLAAFDVFVLSSLAENHSIALLEAMRAGTAVVATDVGGNTESVRHLREAIVVQPGDSNTLAAGIDRLIASPELRATLTAAAKSRFLDLFTIDAMARQTAAWLMAHGRGAQLQTEG